MTKKSKTSEKSGQSLVIVESPAKARTINRYLGAGYSVMACMGHVRDLPSSEMGIDLNGTFEPVYEVLPDKRKIVRELKKVAQNADTVYLATDQDREGEAIAWHLVHALDLDSKRAQRVVFNEITKPAIQHAFAHPHQLDMDKVNAQQARRLLDRIVGYELSPLLQAKLGKGLSAGRVQSVAVRVITERECEIRAFLPQESWRILGCFSGNAERAESLRPAWEKFLAGAKNAPNGRTIKERNAWLSKHGCLSAELVKLAGADFKVADATRARAVAEALGFVTESVAESDFEPYADKGLKTIVLVGRLDPGRAPTFVVGELQKRRTTSKPGAPFTTATIQQSASTNLGFGPARTMRVAQQLYEGVDLGGTEGQTGLITYMRTDSRNLSKESLKAVRALIGAEYGADYLPGKPNLFAKAQRAQEAHEAIRPTSASRQPKSLREKLTADQYKLYNLIWRRFVACQMVPAQWDNTTVQMTADTPEGEAVFRASGRRLVFDGYLKAMGPAVDADVLLPDLQPGAEIPPIQIEPQQQYTSPPPRYSEASLVKKLESEGIGRPSTYAAIIQTIQDRGYVELKEKRLHPTARGEMVTLKLIEHFPHIMDIKFTSHMEKELDKIEEAHVDWVHVLNEFYRPFKTTLDQAHANMERPQAEPSEYTCKECGKAMVYRLGRNGRFLSCSGYPECKESMNVDAEGRAIQEILGEHPCPECGRKMILRRSRLGPFLGCAGYPECSTTIPCDDQGVALKKVQPEDIHETCSDCSSPMTVKFGRGKAFLGCSAYPKCKATQPIPPGLHVQKPPPEDAGVRCDKCGRGMVIRKSRRGPFLSCSGFPRCRNAMPMEKIDELRAKAEAGEIPDPPPDPPPGKPVGAARATRLSKEEVEALGPPPPGFAWTRTGRPVGEVWPEEPLACWQCGREMLAKNGRFGPYFSCEKYPKCKTSANLRGEAKKRGEIEFPSEPKPKPIPTDIACDECGSPMTVRSGRTGPFLGCGTYPKCKATKPFPEGETVESLTGAAAQG